MGVAAVWAVGLGFLRYGGGAERAAGLRDVDVGAAGDAVDGVVVVPTGPLLLRLDAVVCASPRRGRLGTMLETCSLSMDLQFADGMGAMPFFSGRLSNFSVKSSS